MDKELPIVEAMMWGVQYAFYAFGCVAFAKYIWG